MRRRPGGVEKAGAGWCNPPAPGLPLLLLAFPSAAQVQEAWVQRYNGGYTNLRHRPVAMALDGSGNVLVAGSSQSTGTNYDYAVLKYSTDGAQLWAARYAPPAGGTKWSPPSPSTRPGMRMLPAPEAPLSPAQTERSPGPPPTPGPVLQPTRTGTFT